METERKEFETAMWAYYLALKAKGWSAPGEGDQTPEALFWREESGKYGVLSVEAAWNGWQMARKSVVPAAGAIPARIHVTEAMHRAAVKVLHRAHGLDGLPQRMMDAMLSAAPDQAATGVNPELLRGWQHYEKARKLNPRQWAELHRRNLAGEWFDDMIDALPDAETPLPQAAPVAQLSELPKLAFDESHIDYIDRYGGFCRDCADEDGVCPSSGLPCGGSKKAIRHVLTALAYGVNHGYIPVILCAAPTTPKEAS